MDKIDLSKIKESGRIVLASQSPRRKDILTNAGYKFEICVSNADENIDIEDAALLVRELAMLKACDVAKTINGDKYVVGADTVVCINGKILGKPKNERQARLMLKLLSNRTHQVYTGVCVVCKKSGMVISKYEKSDVTFKKLTNSEIFEYVKSGEPMDKAGAYAIQGGAKKFVCDVCGNFDNIIGFSIGLFENILSELMSE